MKNILFLFSTKAGDGNFQEIENKIKNFNYDKSKFSIKIKRTMSPFDTSLISKKFANSNLDNKLLIVCGGDGSLNEVSKELFNTNTALSLLPMGTGNDFSKNFNYKNFKIENILEPTFRKLDIVKLNDKTFLNVFSLGFDVDVLMSTLNILKKYPFLKKEAYNLSALKSIFRLKNYKFSINLNLDNNRSIKLSKYFTMLLVCNGSYYGGGFCPSPTSKIDDGYLEFLAVNPISRFRFINLLPKYKNGSHLNAKEVDLYKVVSGEISSDNEIFANIDGEIIKSNNFKFEIIKNALLWADITI